MVLEKGLALNYVMQQLTAPLSAAGLLRVHVCTTCMYVCVGQGAESQALEIISLKN